MKRKLTDEEFADEYAEHLKLVYFVMRNLLNLNEKWFYDYYSFEDVASVGRVGLIKGIKSYDPDKGVKEISYYSSCIKNEIINTCIISENYQCRNANHNSISLNAPTIKGSEDCFELIDVIYKEEDFDLSTRLFYYKSVLNELIEEGLFNKAEINILKRMSEGYSQAEIAKDLGCTRQNVSRIYLRIIRKLKPYRLKEK